MDNYLNLDYLLNQLKTKQIASTTKLRITKLMNVLQQPKINIPELRELSQFGIPEDIKGLRSLVWKLLMGYLPPDRTQWKKHTQKNAELYEQFCQDFIKSKMLKQYEEQLGADDHPLNKSRDSGWKSFFEDQVIWEEIEKDTIRTRAELSFFVSSTQIENKFPVYFRTQCRRERRQANDFEHRHYDVLTRILFIYAKLNPAIRYVQGMNEILAPFYYVFNSDVNEEFVRMVESDSFFCFTMFMSDAKDSFLRSLDESQDGIKSKMDLLQEYLRLEDHDVWNNLNLQGIHPQFYSLRWIMLYLTQEFELHAVFRIWDSLLAKKNRNQYLIYLCLGILKELRSSLLQNDFTDIMESFKIGEIDVDIVLSHANQIYLKYQ